MKKTFLASLAVAMLLATTARMTAQDPAAGQNKTVAVLSVAGYDNLFAKLEFIGKLSNNPGLAQGLDAQIKMMTQGQGLAGLDTKRPLGVALRTNGDAFAPLGFIPVTDLKQLLGSLAGLIGEAEDAGNGVLRLQTPSGPLFIKEATGWAFLSNEQGALTDAPADPSAWLEGLSTNYDIALRANVQNVPEQFRGLAVNMIKMQVQAQGQQAPGEDETQYELRKKIMEDQVKAISTIINEVDQVTVGWKLDTESRKTHIDFTLTALKGTKTANQFALANGLTSDFAGFVLPGAAAAFNISSKISPEDMEQVTTQIAAQKAAMLREIEREESIPDAEAKKVVQEAVSELFDLATATVQTGKLDFGGSLFLEPGKLSFIGGGYVANGATLDGALKKLAKVAENDENFPGVTFDADKQGNVRFHTMSINVPDEKASTLVGEKLDVAIGVGTKSAYLAIGPNSLATLKKTIDSSTSAAGKAVDPLNFWVALGPVVKFIGSVNDDPTAAMISAALEQSQGKDKVSLVAKGVPNGVNYRLEAEEGVLQVLGEAAKIAAGPIGN